MRGAIVEPGREAGSRALATGSEFVLINPHPLAETLPGVYRDAWIDERRRTAREPFGRRFISALDTVLAPVLATLDNLEAYLDADTTPEDFLVWLGLWVAAPVDNAWSEDRRRAFVGQAAELYRRRGTAAGLRDHVQIHTGGTVEIIENGASSWSDKPEGKLPGSPEPVVVIRVTVDNPDSIDKSKLDALVHASKPAHVVHRVEVVGTGERAARKGKAAAATAEAAVAEAAATAEAAAAEPSPTATAPEPTPPAATASAEPAGDATEPAAEAAPEAGPEPEKPAG